MALPLIRTQRCALQPFTFEDVDGLHALWTAPAVRRYLWDDVVISQAVVEQIIDSHLATEPSHGIGYWSVRVTAAASPGIDGFCGFRFMDDGPDIELLYGLAEGYWRQGLATEACLAAIVYLWRATAFTVLYARTDPPNERSVRVIERLGMTPVTSTTLPITYTLRRP